MSAALNALEREQYQLNDRIDDAREEYQEAVRRQNQRKRELEVAPSADVATKERRFADLRADLAGVQSAISTLRSAQFLSGSDGVFHVYSGVSAFTGEGFVTMRWGAESGQMTPAEAREHALGVLEAADAAENDALTQRLLRERVGLDADTAGAFLVGIRALRGERGQESGGSR